MLDDPHEWAAFSRPDAAGVNCWESNLLIEGMHRAACALSIEEALMRVPGAPGRSQCWQPPCAPGLVGRRSSAICVDARGAKGGYRAVPANDAFARERRMVESRNAIWRLSVAGLCMMQIMMYAYPAYVAAPGDLTQEMEQLLRWASWVLTLPVILFSCGPFFSNALRDIVQRRISMDLPVALGMLITFVVSTAGTFDSKGIFGREVYFDSLSMFVFFLLAGRWLELRLRDRTAGALEALMNRLPDSVGRLCADGTVERGGGSQTVAGGCHSCCAGRGLCGRRRDFSGRNGSG